MVESGNRGIARWRILTRIVRVPVTRPESTVEGSTHARPPSPLHVPRPAVSNVKDLGKRDASPLRRLSEYSTVGLARPDVRRCDNVGKPYPPGLLQERFPSRPRPGGICDYDYWKSLPVEVSDKLLGLGIEFGRVFLQPPFGVALNDPL